MQNLTPPIIYFGSLLALLIGAFVHLIAGGNLLRLVFSLIFSLLGFWVGVYIADRTGISIIPFGPIDYGWSIGISAASAVVGCWLSGERKESD